MPDICQLVGESWPALRSGHRHPWPAWPAYLFQLMSYFQPANVSCDTNKVPPLAGWCASRAHPELDAHPHTAHCQTCPILSTPPHSPYLYIAHPTCVCVCLLRNRGSHVSSHPQPSQTKVMVASMQRSGLNRMWLVSKLPLQLTSQAFASQHL